MVSDMSWLSFGLQDGKIQNCTEFICGILLHIVFIWGVVFVRSPKVMISEQDSLNPYFKCFGTHKIVRILKAKMWTK